MINFKLMDHRYILIDNLMIQLKYKIRLIISHKLNQDLREILIKTTKAIKIFKYKTNIRVIK